MDAEPDPDPITKPQPLYDTVPSPDPFSVSIDRVRDGYECRIRNRDGVLIAVALGDLDLDPTAPYDGAEFRARRGGMLPLRPQPDPNEDAHTLPYPPLTSSVAVQGADSSALVHSLTHSHAHDHPWRPDPTRPRLVGTERHTHAHSHAGRDAYRAHICGHPADPHDHDH